MLGHGKSRSLEHILMDNSSSSSSYDQLTQGGGLTTLPRLRRCDQVPGMWRAEYNDSGGHYSTDTMRSARSVASIKSVQVIIQHSDIVTTKYSLSDQQPSDRVSLQ